MSDAPRRRLRLEVEGLVQGVGFRPFVHRLASQQRLAGWVTNTPAGVSIEVEGSAAALEVFLRALQARRPPHSRIDRLSRRWLPPIATPAGAPGEGQRREKEEERGEALEAFRILPAALVAPPSPLTGLVPPDLAPCGACRAELRDPCNRRYGYAFNSCAHCGPRYSVLRALPFERTHTTLAGFALCAACQRDFRDPGDRRFHAQTIGCPACGPQLSWRQRDAGGIDNGDGDGNSVRGPSAAALAAAAAALRRDQVVALQGVGGFQLLVRAASAVAVAELRRRKGRPEQPFAVLIPHLAWARRHCQVSAAEARLLVSPAAPIVLLRKRTAPLADGVAPHTPWLGVMLPASPLHALLLEAVGQPLVATSGNRSGEPLGFSEADGLDLLTHLADGLLSHNRPIANPVDDGVAQVVAGAVMVLRQARGTAPTAIALPDPTPPPAEQPGQPHQHRQPHQPRQADVLLAMGGQVKSAIAIGQDRRALLGPHLGDLGTLAGERRLTDSLLSWLDRQQLRPSRLAIDLHPGYSAHRLGRELAEAWGGLPVLAVQHHHAHLLACLAEHGLPLPATGVAWDGAGFGPDGLLWGGEALRLEPPRAGAALGFTHLARLRPFPLPGGERALREPRRAALGLLVAAFGADSQAHTPPATRAAFGEGEQQLLERLLLTDLKTPLCTSMGRLFDALASLLGLVQRCSFEGQGALRLQAAAQAALDAPEPQGWPAYRLPIGLPIGAAAPAASASGISSPWELDWQPLLVALLDDLARGRPVPSIALAFHRALAAVLVELAQRLQLRRLLLSGGCFQNRLLLELAVAALAAAGVEAVWPQRVPCNDGGLALGQLLALAWSACEEGAEPGAQAPFLAL